MNCHSKTLITGLASLAFLVVTVAAQNTNSGQEKPTVIVNTALQPLTEGKFAPNWESLQQYQVPEWFRDAKFGIWAHWGPQCQPEAGDWYARLMYFQGTSQYDFHVKKYGHPSEFGFKDVINAWKAENWDPDKLVALYKEAGAQYLFAMANHHDNLDLWDSKYHPWNSLNVGPKTDVVEGWAKAAKKYKLPFGLSVHSSHAWTWYEGTKGSDKTGPMAGVPYDGNLTKEDGKGTWWEGLDPQVLYANNHEHSEKWDVYSGIFNQWAWEKGTNLPDQAYCDNFYNRTMDLLRRYQPDLVYFDDTVLPLFPFSDAGLKIVSNFYNENMQRNKGKLDAVVFGKMLSEEQRKALVWDIERGASNEMLPYPWQTCTCIGQWHYDRSVYEKNRYKSATTVLQMLADIVSKNGNLLLNIPVRGDGSIDDKEVAILEGIGDWMKINSESIFGTRPWKIFGEGPASSGAAMREQGFNEGKGKAYTEQDIRFTTKDKVLYAIVLNCSGDKKISIFSLGVNSALIDHRKVTSVKQLGSKNKLAWTQTEQGLSADISGNGVVVLKILGVL